ncbi:MAG: hypothetical protein HDT35_04595 [Clostridiales bacterium]|nr:hypothetical protein [Clostridiales bacterium]
MKHTKKRVAALLLALAMVLSLMPMAFAADEYSDMPAEDDASYAAVKSAVDNGIISGENGSLNLDDNIIRSTMAAMVTRTFGAKGETTLSGYSDVDDSHWAVQQGALPAAVQMGIMSGSNGKMLANDPVTREQAWAMLARALKLEKGTAADLEGIPGADSLSAWAIPEIASLVKAQYISDVSNATEPMTRVEFAEVIYSVSGGNYVKEDGEYTEDVDGNIIITANGVSLKGITVKGDVIIADGVDAGSINLDGVKIEGRLLVRGGSEVALTNGTTAASTVVAKTSDEVTVSADKASDAGAITVDAKADKVTVNMPEPNVTVASATEVAVQNAEGGSVTLAASGATVAVESGTLENVTVADGASDVKVDVAEGATIEMVTTNTDLTITGEGTVEEKEGSGTVTDASGNEVGGSNEPADVPTVSDVATAPAGPTAPNQTAHVHNYATKSDNGDTPVYTQFNATHHLVACVDHTKNGDGDTQAVTTGCGAVVTAPHTFTSGTCTACGQKEQKVTESITGGTGAGTCGGNHVWVLDESAADNAEATCTTAGKMTYKCSNDAAATTRDGDEEPAKCSATKVVTTPAKGHNYQLTESTPVTCAGGTQTYTCTVCADGSTGHTKTVTIAAGSVPHTYSTSTVTNAATHTATGTRTWTCSVCTDATPGHTTTETIAKTATHTWIYALEDGKHVGTCACGETQEHAPALASSWTSNDDQHWQVCTVAGCGLTTTKTNHTWDDAGKVCTACGKPKPAEEEEEPAHVHKWENGVCTAAGANNCKCTNENHATDVAAKYTPQEGCATCHAKGTKNTSTCPQAQENAEGTKHSDLEAGKACATCGYTAPTT